ncbi:hypothetical protein [Janibacter melonis]|uniref:hypothetical protein n=1 Tax=Janibacter melonis TaxID=262209 RepID=UPI0020951D69|nr:hypothetical protein [Janibacter melonis]
MVYETLSTGFSEEADFGEIAVRGLRGIIEVARTQGSLDSRVEGSFGWMGPNEATSVALILSELVQNAVEHGVPDGERSSCGPSAPRRTARTSCG